MNWGLPKWGQKHFFHKLAFTYLYNKFENWQGHNQGTRFNIGPNQYCLIF